MGYPIGRIVIESMRSDAANHILGLRVNTWVSILVFLLGVVLLVALRHDAERAWPVPGPSRTATREPGDWRRQRRRAWRRSFGEPADDGSDGAEAADSAQERSHGI